jgi:hypothetical protein
LKVFIRISNIRLVKILRFSVECGAGLGTSCRCGCCGGWFVGATGGKPNSKQWQAEGAKDISAPTNGDGSQIVFTFHYFVHCCLVGEPEKVAKN